MPTRTHVVQPGENMSTIAQHLGMTLLALEAANPRVRNPDVIHPGDELNIPSGAEPGSSTSTKRLHPVLNTLGHDIASSVSEAADAAGISPMALLALLKAESGLNPHAEHWGAKRDEAQAAIANGNHAELERIIGESWPDISFGYSQRIVEFHELGDRTRSVSNCLAVRDGVFANPTGDIAAAATRLAGFFRHPTCDGSALSAMLVYNAGSDQRENASWMKRFSGNVANYTSALEWAKQFIA